MMIGRPSSFDAASDIARITRSVPEPAAQGTMKMIGLVGKSCTTAPPASKANAIDVDAALRIVRLIDPSSIGWRRQPDIVSP
jgi:hypothetical protein